MPETLTIELKDAGGNGGSGITPTPKPPPVPAAEPVPPPRPEPATAFTPARPTVTTPPAKGKDGEAPGADLAAAFDPVIEAQRRLIAMQEEGEKQRREMLVRREMDRIAPEVQAVPTAGEQLGGIGDLLGKAGLGQLGGFVGSVGRLVDAFGKLGGQERPQAFPERHRPIEVLPPPPRPEPTPPPPATSPAPTPPAAAQPVPLAVPGESTAEAAAPGGMTPAPRPEPEAPAGLPPVPRAEPAQAPPPATSPTPRIEVQAPPAEAPRIEVQAPPAAEPAPAPFVQVPAPELPAPPNVNVEAPPPAAPPAVEVSPQVVTPAARPTVNVEAPPVPPAPAVEVPPPPPAEAAPPPTVSVEAPAAPPVPTAEPTPPPPAAATAPPPVPKAPTPPPAAAAGEGAAGAAEGAGLAAGADMAALAAGPIGAVVVAAKMVEDQVAQSMKSAVQGVGEAAQGIASLDASSFGEQFAKLGETVPLVGPALGEATRQMMAFMDALDGTAKKLSGYNADLALAQAQAEVTQTLGDIKRANQLGPGLAEYTEAKSRLSDSGQDIMAKLLEPMLPMISDMTDMLAKMAENVSTGLTDLKTGVFTVAEFLKKWSGGLLMGDDSPLGKYLKRIADNTQKAEKDDGTGGMNDILGLLNSFDFQSSAAMAPLNASASNRRPLGI